MTLSLDTGEGVREGLKKSSAGRVIASFRKAMYIRVGAHVFALTIASVPSGPLHARMNTLPLGAVGDLVEVREGELRVVDRVVPISEQLWVPTVFPDMRRATGLLSTVLCHVPNLNLSGTSDDLLEDDLARLLQVGDLVGACARVIGHGVGLTPAGDDVAAGILAVDSILGVHHRVMREGIVSTAATHEISRAFLRWAAVGQSIETLHTFLQACALGQEVAARVSRARLTEHGYSSGLDLAYGALMALRYLPSARDAAHFSDLRPAPKGQAQMMK
ncbi:MAG: DUF2877 domain-containing protein [Candidatus Nanopelagicales bacterium]